MLPSPSKPVQVPGAVARVNHRLRGGRGIVREKFACGQFGRRFAQGSCPGRVGAVDLYPEDRNVWRREIMGWRIAPEATSQASSGVR